MMDQHFEYADESQQWFATVHGPECFTGFSHSKTRDTIGQEIKVS